MDDELYIDVLITNKDCLKVLAGELIVAKPEKINGQQYYIGIRNGEEDDAP